VFLLLYFDLLVEDEHLSCSYYIMIVQVLAYRMFGLHKKRLLLGALLDSIKDIISWTKYYFEPGQVSDSGFNP
jgi:hypothetical protein